MKTYADDATCQTCGKPVMNACEHLEYPCTIEDCAVIGVNDLGISLKYTAPLYLRGPSRTFTIRLVDDEPKKGAP